MDNVMLGTDENKDVELPNFKAIPSEGWVYHYLKNFIDASRAPAQSSMVMPIFMGAANNNRRHGEEGTLTSIIGVDNIDAYTMSTQPKRYHRGHEEDSKFDHDAVWDRIVTVIAAGEEHYKSLKENFSVVQNIKPLRNILGLSEKETELLRLLFVMQVTELHGVVQSAAQYTGSVDQTLAMMMATDARTIRTSSESLQRLGLLQTMADLRAQAGNSEAPQYFGFNGFGQQRETPLPFPGAVIAFLSDGAEFSANEIRLSLEGETAQPDHDLSIEKDFDFLDKKQVSLLRALLSKQYADGEERPLIILKGEVGTGKTEFAKLISKAVGKKLKLAGEPGPDNQVVKHAKLIGDVSVKLRIASKAEDIIVGVDEAERLNADTSNPDQKDNAAKVILNRLGENTDAPVILICNSNNFDVSVFRRSALIIEFPGQGHEFTKNLWRRIATKNGVSLGNKVVNALVERYGNVAPALMRTALKNQKLHPVGKIDTVITTLNSLLPNVRGTTRPEPPATTPDISFDSGLIQAKTSTGEDASTFLAKIPKQISTPSFLLAGKQGNGEDGLAYAIANRFNQPSPFVMSSSQFGKPGILSAVLNKCYDAGQSLIIDDRVAESFPSVTEGPAFYDELRQNVRRGDVPIIMITDSRIAGRYADMFAYNLEVQPPNAAIASKVLAVSSIESLPNGATLGDCFKLARQLITERPRSAALGEAMSAAEVQERLNSMVGMRISQRNAIRPPPDRFAGAEAAASCSTCG